MSKAIKIYVDNKGRDCDGCTKCCDGWLSTQIYNFDVGPDNGPCRFVIHKGCSIYQVRPRDPCQVFQCAWKENDKIPYFMKPDLSKVILLLRYLEGMPFYRIIKCQDKMEPKVMDWAQTYSEQGHNLLGYDGDGKLLVFSKDPIFRQKALQKY